MYRNSIIGAHTLYTRNNTTEGWIGLVDLLGSRCIIEYQMLVILYIIILNYEHTNPL